MLKEFFSKIKKIEKKYIFITLVILLFVVGFIVYKFVFNEKVQYTVVSGYVEKVSENQGVVILDEEVVNTQNDSAIIPIIEEGKRASKDEVVAKYKNAEYDEYLNKINDMDKQIETLIKDLPVSYSSDVSAIDQEISKLSVESMKITSYIKMQEYKKQIDELSKKKVTLLSELSPSGSKIRELTEQRQKYEDASNNLGSNIKASVGGIVSYKVDSLENSINIDNVLNSSIQDIENYYLSYLQNNVSNFGIKMINNYEAYVVVKEARGENDEYISLNKRYKLRLVDNNYEEITGQVVVFLQDEQYNYVIFKVTDNIEKIYADRLISFEVVWKRVEDLAIPVKALKYNELKDYYYVIALKYGEYVELPVKLKISSDTVAIVSKYSSEEKEELSIDSKYDIKLYDRIVVE